MTCAAPCTRRGRTCHGRPAALAGLGRARRTRGGFSRSGATTPSHQRTGARPRSWGTPRRARSSAASRDRAPAWVVATETTTSGWARSARTATRACRSTARRRLCRRRRRHRSRCARRGKRFTRRSYRHHYQWTGEEARTATRACRSTARRRLCRRRCRRRSRCARRGKEHATPWLLRAGATL